MGYLQYNYSNEQGGNGMTFNDLTLEITWHYFCCTEVTTWYFYSGGGTKTHLFMGRESKNSTAFFFNTTLLEIWTSLWIV